jgi:PAS domain-containing protein
MENLRWILDGLPMGVWVARAPDGVVEYVNRAFQVIVGIDAVGDSRIGDAAVTYGPPRHLGSAAHHQPSR